MRARERRMRNRKVLVLNSSYEVLTFVTWQKAVTHIVSGVAVPLDSDADVIIRSAGGLELPLPASIIMKNYVHVQWSENSLNEELAAKSAILHRDGMCCMYCGQPGTTIDHIIPKAQGGQDTWWNLTASCIECNSYKADRTPQEAGMELFREPFKPEDTSRRAVAQKAIYARLESGDLNISDDFWDSE